MYRLRPVLLRARQMRFLSKRPKNTDAQRYSPGERYASTYEINMLRCIFAVIAKMRAPLRLLCWSMITS